MGGLRKGEPILSQFWRPEVQEVSAGSVPPGGAARQDPPHASLGARRGPAAVVLRGLQIHRCGLCLPLPTASSLRVPQDTSHIGSEPTRTQDDLTLTRFYLQRSHFQIRSRARVAGGAGG